MPFFNSRRMRSCIPECEEPRRRRGLCSLRGLTAPADFAGGDCLTTLLRYYSTCKRTIWACTNYLARPGYAQDGRNASLRRDYAGVVRAGIRRIPYVTVLDRL